MDSKYTELNRALRQATQSSAKLGPDVLAEALRGFAAGHLHPLVPSVPSPPVASGTSNSPYNPSLSLSPPSLEHGRELASLLGLQGVDNNDGDDQDGAGGLSNPLGLLSDACLDEGPVRAGGWRDSRRSNVGAALALADLGVLPDDIAAVSLIQARFLLGNHSVNSAHGWNRLHISGC